MREVLDCFELTDSCFLGIKTVHIPAIYTMPRELQSTIEAPGLEWPVLRIHIPCMAHLMQLGWGAFMSSLDLKGHTESWESHEHDQELGENECIDIGKGRTLRNERNATINKELGMRPGLAKIIVNVCISRNFESPETDLHRAENTCYINYADTTSSERVHWLSTSDSTNRSNTYYPCEDRVEFDTAVAAANILISRIHTRVAHESNIQSTPAALHNTGWMDNHQVCHGRFIAILILDLVDVEKAYGYPASHDHCVQWHVRLYGWCYGAFAEKKTQWMGDFYFAMKVAWQNLSTYYAKVTPMTDTVIESAHTSNLFGSCNRFGSGTNKWISIPRTRHLYNPIP